MVYITLELTVTCWRANNLFNYKIESLYKSRHRRWASFDYFKLGILVNSNEILPWYISTNLSEMILIGLWTVTCESKFWIIILLKYKCTISHFKNWVVNFRKYDLCQWLSHNSLKRAWFRSMNCVQLQVIRVGKRILWKYSS